MAEEERKKQFIREKIPEEKLRQVEQLVQDIKQNRTFMFISIKSLPASQFQKIKKKLIGKAKIKMLKKRIILRAISKIEKGRIKNMRNYVKENTAVLVSDTKPFELSAILADNKRPIKAKPGQESVEDIIIEAGPTDLPPGPAVSEFSSVGLKIAIENGKINIKESKAILKKGDTISQKAADVMAKLGIEPFEIGIEPVVAYDSQEDEIYTELRIDKKETMEKLKGLASKGLALAVSISYSCKDTISFLLIKANNHEKAIEKFVKEKPVEKEEKQKTEEKAEEVKQEEKIKGLKEENKKQEEKKEEVVETKVEQERPIEKEKPKEEEKEDNVQQSKENNKQEEK